MSLIGNDEIRDLIFFFEIGCIQALLSSNKGKRTKFSVKLNITGSVLQKKIWKQLSNISYGTTKTYGDIAKALRTSPRYVGNVCGQNNHLLVIPCHRVVRSDGALGGFSGLGGIKLKQKMEIYHLNHFRGLFLKRLVIKNSCQH